MELTKQKAIKEHRQMWNWIAEQCENWNNCKSDPFEVLHIDLKQEYFDFHNKEYALNCCFCCDYANHDCSNCPVEWGTENTIDVYYCLDKEDDFDDLGLYGKWLNATDNMKAAELARQIANLPEKF